MVKITTTYLICLLTIVGRSFSQEPELDLNRILSSTRPEEFRNAIQPYIDKYKGTALALYLEAFVETDAAKAVEKYQKILVKYPKSAQAELAQFKTAEYYFSRGLYISARKYFLELIEKFPQSQYVDDSMYFAAACLYAAGKYKSSYAELTNFLTQNPSSPLRELAQEDLKELKGRDEIRNSRVVPSKPDGKYALQIGAFSQVNNALNLKSYCTKLGIPVEILEKTANDKTIYLVWIGSFETEGESRTFGERFKREHGKLFRVVQR